MENTLGVSACNGRDRHPFADHMTKLRNFTQEENRDFLAILFSLQFMLEQALTNLILCLIISQKLHKRASMLQWILGRVVFAK